MEPHLSATGEAQSEGQGALPRFFSVSQYSKSVERKIKQEIPRVWVQGTITQLNVRGRVAYLTLAEFETDDARPKAAIDVFLWSGELEAINARFSLLPTPFALKVMLKVALQLEPGFYVPTGRFQPHVLDVDPRFTLGELALTRANILAKLRKDGLLEKNKSLFFSPFPLRIGLITAPGSAAYQDFTTVLLGSGFGFQILFMGARMQGDKTEASVVEALRRLEALRPDCICIVRGGGARTDLVYFDSEAICRAIALASVPVLTGIGHEIDRSLADEVAHADLITPTDCAKFLEEKLQHTLQSLMDRGVALRQSWRQRREQESHFLAEAAHAVGRAFSTARDRENTRARAFVARMRQGLRFHLEEAQLHLRRNGIGLQRGPAKSLTSARWKLRHRGEQLRGHWGRRRGAIIQALIGRKRDLAQRLFSTLQAAGQGAEVKSRWLRTVDPAFVLRLGYALVRNARGETLSGAGQSKVGDRLTLEWHDGRIEAEVRRKDGEV